MGTCDKYCSMYLSAPGSRSVGPGPAVFDIPSNAPVLAAGRTGRVAGSASSCWGRAPQNITTVSTEPPHPASQRLNLGLACPTQPCVCFSLPSPHPSLPHFWSGCMTSPVPLFSPDPPRPPLYSFLFLFAFLTLLFLSFVAATTTTIKPNHCRYRPCGTLTLDAKTVERTATAPAPAPTLVTATALAEASAVALLHNNVRRLPTSADSNCTTLKHHPPAPACAALNRAFHPKAACNTAWLQQTHPNPTQPKQPTNQTTNLDCHSVLDLNLNLTPPPRDDHPSSVLLSIAAVDGTRFCFP